MTGGGEVHVHGGGYRAWRGLGDMTGGGEVHVEGARGHDWRRRGARTWRGL